jgi:hypothetical protein
MKIETLPALSGSHVENKKSLTIDGRSLYRCSLYEQSLQRNKEEDKEFKKIEERTTEQDMKNIRR